MTVLLMEGFDKYPDNLTQAGYGYFSVYPIFGANSAYYTLAAGRHTGKSFQFESVGSTYRYTQLPWWVLHTSLTLGFAFYCDASLITMGAAVPIAHFAGPLGIQCSLVLTASGQLLFYRGYVATLLGSSATGVINTTDAGWYYVEMSVAIADSGSYDIRVDNALVLTGTGDTKQTTDEGADSVYVGGNAIASPRPVMRADDLYVIDSLTPLGPQRIETLDISSDTGTKDFLRSTGSGNFSLIDDRGDVTDFTYSTAIGEDLFEVANLSDNPTNISAVMVCALIQRMEVAPRTFRSRIKSGASFANGSNLFPSPIIKWGDSIFTTNPSTGAAWTGAAVNGFQVGYGITS